MIIKRKCFICKELKELNQFYKDRNRKDGHQYHCKKCIKEYQKGYQREYYSKNKDKIKADKRKYYLEHKKYYKDYAKQYRSERRDELNEYWRKWFQGKYKTDIMFKLNESMSTGMYKSLKGNKEGLHWETLVPYKLEGLKKWLEDRFLPGMTWENYGSEWHVDHKRPISSFKFKSYKDLQFQVCWALSNLQPLWEEDNLKKGSKIIEDYQMLLKI